ncbi:MAG TPA: class I SAM-dependent methyltransferase [Anaerolineae bacterium]
MEIINSYSRTWFEVFLETQAHTEVEVDFIRRHLPNPPYQRVLDLCCGQGRHTNLLAEYGYDMVGVDLDGGALEKAQQQARGQVVYRQMDMRRLESLPGSFDAILSLWQSFGYFEETTNRDILRQISEKLRPHGRFILDIYHRGYFERHQGVRRVERRGVVATITNTMRGNRLTAELSYNNGGSDSFEWQLFTPEEICALAEQLGLRCVLRCAWFDEQRPATAEQARIQFVLEKV